MVRYKMEFTFELEEQDDNLAGEIEARCYQEITDYAVDTGLDLVYQIDENEKH